MPPGEIACEGKVYVHLTGRSNVATGVLCLARVLPQLGPDDARRLARFVAEDDRTAAVATFGDEHRPLIEIVVPLHAFRPDPAADQGTQKAPLAGLIPTPLGFVEVRTPPTGPGEDGAARYQFLPVRSYENASGSSLSLPLGGTGFHAEFPMSRRPLAMRVSTAASAVVAFGPPPQRSLHLVFPSRILAPCLAASAGSAAGKRDESETEVLWLMFYSRARLCPSGARAVGFVGTASRVFRGAASGQALRLPGIPPSPRLFKELVPRVDCGTRSPLLYPTQAAVPVLGAPFPVREAAQALGRVVRTAKILRPAEGEGSPGRKRQRKTPSAAIARLAEVSAAAECFPELV